MYGISPFSNAITCTSRGILRISTRQPFTFNIQIIGLSSTRLGSVQSGCIWKIFSVCRIFWARPLAVCCETPILLQSSSARMCGDWDLSNKKFTCPSVYRIPAAHDFACPFTSGEGRFRARVLAILRARSAYSSLRYSLQKVSLMEVISSYSACMDSGTFSEFVFTVHLE